MRQSTNIWVAWDGGDYAVVGCGNISDDDEMEAEPHTTFAITAGFGTTNDDLIIDAFSAPGRFIRAVALPRDTKIISVFRDLREFKLLRAFELVRELDPRRRQLIGLTASLHAQNSRRPDQFTRVFNTMSAREQNVRTPTSLVARGRRLLWAASSALDEASADNPQWLRVGPATRAFPLADGSVRATASLERVEGAAVDRPDEPAVVCASVAHSPPRTHIFVDVAYGDAMHDDATEGLVVAHIQRQRMTLRRWLSFHEDAVTLSASDLRAWFEIDANDGGDTENDAFACTTQRLLGDVSRSGDGGPIEIFESHIAPVRRDGGQRRFDVCFNIAVRGDHVLVADIIGTRLIGPDGQPTNCIGFEVESNRLAPRTFDIGQEPYCCVEWAAQSAHHDGDSPARSSGSLRAWLRAVTRDNVSPLAFELLPLYALAYDLARESMPHDMALDFEDYLDWPAICTLRPKIALDAQSSFSGSTSEKAHLVARLFAHLGRAAAVCDDLDRDAQMRAYYLVTDDAHRETLRNMFEFGARFDKAAAADLDGFAERLRKLKTLLDDPRVVRACKSQPVSTYFAGRKQGQFIGFDGLSQVIADLGAAKTRIETIRRSFLEGGTTPTPVGEDESLLERLKAEFHTLLDAADAGSPIVARLRDLVSKTNPDDPEVFYEVACETLRQLSPRRSQALDTLVKRLEDWANYAGGAESTRESRIEELVRACRHTFDRMGRGAQAEHLSGARRALEKRVVESCDRIQREGGEAEERLINLLPAYAHALTLHKAFTMLERDQAKNLLIRARGEGRAVAFDRMMLLWPLEADSAWARFQEIALDLHEPDLAAQYRWELETLPLLQA